jgi:hypothetical protein
LQSSSNSRMSSACGSVGEEPRVSVTMLGCADEHERSNNLYQSVGVLCAQVRCMAPGWEVAVLPRTSTCRTRAPASTKTSWATSKVRFGASGKRDGHNCWIQTWHIEGREDLMRSKAHPWRWRAAHSAQR